MSGESRRLPRIAIPVRAKGSRYGPEIDALVVQLTQTAVDSIRGEGAEPVLVACDAGEAIDVSAYDGLLLLGGGDVDPGRYGDETRHADLWGVSEKADECELTAARDALSLGVPVFGICRGMQVLNVASGGSLVQALPDSEIVHRDAEDGPVMVHHPVRIEEGSRLRAILESTEPDVTSGHHQGVKSLGEGLKVAARSADGLVEAIEHEDTWALGVQWHPEDAGADVQDRAALFGAFVNAAKDRLSRGD